MFRLRIFCYTLVRMITTYLGEFVKIFVQIYSFLVFVAALLTWFPHRPRGVLFDFIREVTDPAFNFVKKIIPPIGMMDISAIVLIIGLQLLEAVLLQLLHVV